MIAGVLGCLLGTLAGAFALSEELEHQFHGGVLEEDRVRVMWQNAWTTVRVFAEVAFATLFVFGVLPVSIRRLVSGARR